MQPIPKIVDQGYTKQTILFSQTYKGSAKSIWSKFKDRLQAFYFRIRRLLFKPFPSVKTTESSFNLVSSFEGNISKILFAFPYRYFEKGDNPYNTMVKKIWRKTFSQVIQLMDEELAKLYIITEKKAESDIRKWLVDEEIITDKNKDNFEFIFTKDEDFSIWVQDPVVVGKLDNTLNHFIKTPNDFERSNDQAIGELIVNSGSIFFKSFFTCCNRSII